MSRNTTIHKNSIYFPPLKWLLIFVIIIATFHFAPIVFDETRNAETEEWYPMWYPIDNTPRTFEISEYDSAFQIWTNEDGTIAAKLSDDNLFKDNKALDLEVRVRDETGEIFEVQGRMIGAPTEDYLYIGDWNQKKPTAIVEYQPIIKIWERVS